MAGFNRRGDCTKVVIRIENHDEAFIDLHFTTGAILHISSKVPRARHVKRYFETCPDIEVKTIFHPHKGKEKKSIRNLWIWFLRCLSLRIVPVFIDFTDAHPESTRGMLKVIKCTLIVRMQTHDTFNRAALNAKMIPEVQLVDSGICTSLPKAPKIMIDATQFAEHRDYRKLLHYETREFHYIAAKPLLTLHNWAALFKLYVDKVTVRQDHVVAKVFWCQEMLLDSLAMTFNEVLDNCHRARAIAHAKNMEVHFAYIMNDGHMALLQSPAFGSKNLSDVRRMILKNVRIPPALVALHCSIWNPITFKITFGNGVNMETLVDDTVDADPAYNLTTIVNVGLTHGW